MNPNEIESECLNGIYNEIANVIGIDATRAIDKGMPIEQLKTFLGHTEVDTTLVYVQVQQRNVKRSHELYLC